MPWSDHARKVALRQTRPDLTLTGGQVLNVFTGELIRGDVAVADGIVVGVGRFEEGRQSVDVTGKTVLPGLIDGHLHLESSMLAPSRFIPQALLRGTTTFIVDPHECANVRGGRGIDFILEDTEDLPANVYVMLPSCVPCTPFEDNGQPFTAGDMRPYLNHPRVLGLGEVMDYVSVTEGETGMMEKLRLFEGRVRDGHLPAQFPDPILDAYTLAGIATNHECSTFEEAWQQRRRGMQVLIREGSAARNLESIVRGMVSCGCDSRGFSFCTDDKHIEDIRREGHINYCVKKAIALGLSPVAAVQMATINTARCYGLSHLGAIAPGYQADLLVVDSLESMQAERVFVRGRAVSARQCGHPLPLTPELTDTVRLQPVTARQLRLPVPTDGQGDVLELVPGQLLTRRVRRALPQRDGLFAPDRHLQKIAVIERHHATGKIGLGVIGGFGITQGAIATTVSHDSHNLTVVGDNDEDMLLAIRELEKVGGGYTIVCRGQVAATLPLPILGLMSTDDFDTVFPLLHHMVERAHAMGVSREISPFTTLSFVSLPVIPEIRITPRGLFCVMDQQFLPPPDAR